jgi:hypothetical protein
MPEHHEHDDELAALRDADPFDPADVPSPTRPEAVALFERITMADTTSAGRRETSQPPRRRTTLAAAAVVVAVIAVAGGAFALSRDGETSRTNTPDEPFTPVPSESPTSAPVTPGGPSSASCVEIYDLTTLASRETAFDGTVVAVAGDEVTFAVNRWYTRKGGEAITLKGASTLAGTTSAGDAVSLERGTRLLVAGDGGFAWSCGFTQPYDAARAEQWADAFMS